ETVWSPNAGAGVWFSNNRMFTGFSVPVLLEQGDVSSDLIQSNVGNVELAESTRHYYYTLGFLIPVKENFSLKPYTLAKYTEGSPVQLDASLSMVFYDFLWVGGSYRTDNSVTIMAEYFLIKNATLQKREIGFGYAYNFRTGSTAALFGPTHELFIAFNLDKHNTLFKNPRFF
ncbi:MAG: type IX secretion system membrane protein PorP/SprF, partial [Chitinophagales bacterium]